MSGGLVMLSAPAATAGDEGTPSGNPTKTTICHRTASDTNPYVFIEVDDESLPAHLNNLPGHPAKHWKSDGTWRGDDHKAGDAKNDYVATSAEDCQDEGDHPTVIETLPTVDVYDPCGTANDKVTLSTNEDEYTGHDNGDGTATFTAEPGYVFPSEEHTYVVNYTMPTNVPCERSIDIPAAPGQTDPCGPGNASWNVPGDTELLDWSLVNGVLSVSIIPAGVTFTDQTTSHSYGTATDSGAPCPETIQIPAAPSQTDPCGLGNATWDVPADTATLDWSLVNGVLSVSIIPAGVTFTDQTTSHSYGTATDSGEPCIAGVEEIAPTVSFTDPTCERLNRAKWSGNLTDLVDYAVSGTPGRGNSVTVTANIKPAVADEFAFPAGFDNTFDHSYPSKADLNCATVKGSESSRPKPQKTPTVLGTQAVAPTAVDAGLASLPGDSASSTASLLAQLMVAGGLLLLLAGGWLGLGRREYGAHQA